jgi:DNA repair exonuclease SbcCD ATPase subunit
MDIKRIVDNTRISQQDLTSHHSVDQEQTNCAPPAGINSADDQVQTFAESEATLFHELVHAEHSDAPAKFAPSDLNASANDIPIEELTIQGDTISLTSGSELRTQIHTAFDKISTENPQLESLKQQLEVLKIQKQALMTQINQVTSQIQGLEQSQPPNIQGLTQLQQQLASLQNQLAKVDTQIKEILNEIAKLQDQEAQAQDQANQSEEQNQNIMKNLDKAADAYADILKATDLD